jgi:hypothetical protein
MTLRAGNWLDLTGGGYRGCGPVVGVLWHCCHFISLFYCGCRRRIYTSNTYYPKRPRGRRKNLRLVRCRLFRLCSGRNSIHSRALVYSYKGNCALGMENIAWYI